MSNENTNVNVVSNGADENATNENTTPETKATTPAPAKRIKKVKIKLPFTKAEQDDVLVGVNGKTWLIKRGVEVEVPAYVAEVLQHSEDMRITAMEYENSLGDGN